MFNLCLISIIFAPALLGMLAARSPSRRRGVFLLAAFLMTYNLLYILLLLYLRHRWVG